MKRTVQQRLGKKILLSMVAIGALTTFSSNAQTGFLGVNVGPQYTTINSNSQNFNGGIGYNAALSAEIRFNQQFGLEAQFGLSALSASTKYRDSITYNDYVARFDNNYTFNTTWMQGQLLAKYYIRLGGEPITPYDRPEGSGNYFYILAGGYIGFIPSPGNIGHVGRTGTQRRTFHVNNSPTSQDVVSDTSFNNSALQETQDRLIITPMDYGFTVGAGISLRLSQSANLDFGFRFSDGLTTIDNPDPSLLSIDKKINNTDLVNQRFFLGHNTLVVKGNTANLNYSPANATNMFIAFNIGLKFKIFGDSY